MNTYSLYTRSAKLYVVEATSCDKAIARLALAAPGETVSCWFVGQVPKEKGLIERTIRADEILYSHETGAGIAARMELTDRRGTSGV